MRILIANRGEIARRIIRTAHRLGHETVAVFADPDRRRAVRPRGHASFRLGPADLAASYLSIDRLLAASGRPGPTPSTPATASSPRTPRSPAPSIDAGLPGSARTPRRSPRWARRSRRGGSPRPAGVPIIPGFDELTGPGRPGRRGGTDRLSRCSSRPRRAVAARASASSTSPRQFAAAAHEAASEAERSFGDRAMIVERYIERPRHVEVQVVGDRHGNVIHLGTRECSVQRRYQKLLEEAPAPNLPDATRAGPARRRRSSWRPRIGYDSAGTVEFVVDDATGEYFFLEMNTRLQVEHPVTEAVTGLDLVELRSAAAAGEPLPGRPGRRALHRPRLRGPHQRRGRRRRASHRRSAGSPHLRRAGRRPLGQRHRARQRDHAPLRLDDRQAHRRRAATARPPGAGWAGPSTS